MSPLTSALTTLIFMALGLVICITVWLLIETYRYQRRRKNMLRLERYVPIGARDMTDWLAFTGRVEALNAELAVPLGYAMYATPTYVGQYRIYLTEPGRALRRVFPDDITANIYDPEVGRQALAAAVSFLLRAA